MLSTAPTKPVIEGGVIIYSHDQHSAKTTQQSSALRRYCQAAGLEVTTAPPAWIWYCMLPGNPTSAISVLPTAHQPPSAPKKPCPSPRSWSTTRSPS